MNIDPSLKSFLEQWWAGIVPSMPYENKVSLLQMGAFCLWGGMNGHLAESEIQTQTALWLEHVHSM